MAAASPILINSSSPFSIRITSVTPPGDQRGAETSLSPKLPSPSTFIRPRALGLKSGSKIQPAPEGVELGFASAATLWEKQRHQLTDESGGSPPCGLQDGETVARGVEAGNGLAKGEGKLPKPKKLKKPRPVGAKDTPTSLQESECRDFRDRTLEQGSGYQPEGQNVYDFTVEPDRLLPDDMTRSEMDVPVAAVKATTSVAVGATGATKIKKKSRKKDASAADEREPKVKKPRKRKTKSESIILNSDEPDPVGDVLAPAVTTKDTPTSIQLPNDTPKAKKTSARAPKKGKAKEMINDAHTDPNDLPRGNSRQDVADVGALEQSAYFARPNAPTTGVVEGEKASVAEQSRSDEVSAPTEHADNVDESCPFFARRRRSWTPARDTEDVNLQSPRPTTARSELSDAQQATRIPLADVLKSFGYVSAETPTIGAPQRTPSGEAVTKRRRVELTETPASEAPKRKSIKKAAPKPPKPKAAPKKPQTITAVATAAFQPPKAAEDNMATLSAFFSPGLKPAEITTNRPTVEPEPEPVAAKPKKPRKRRIKILDADQAITHPSDPTKAKKTPVPRKKKPVKLPPPAPPPLYSPIRAVAQIKQQAILFGSSSQLEPAESPAFIRELQAALAESEAQLYRNARAAAPLSSPLLGSSQPVVSPPQTKSSIRVPSAPHGTCLSIGQAGREFWSAGARGVDGGLLVVDRAVGADGLGRDEMCDRAGTTDQLGSLLTEAGPAEQSGELPDAPRGIESAAPELRAVALEPSRELVVDVPVQNLEEDDDSWMVLKSDDSDPVPAQEPLQRLVSPIRKSHKYPDEAEHPSTALKDIASGPPFRPALQPLDSNLNLSSRSIFEKDTVPAQIRPFSTAHDLTKASAKPRGRPRKKADAGTNEDLPGLPKKRGRPPKTAATAFLTSPAKPSDPKTSRALNAAASQPAPQSSWLDIDEISDSDAPQTPSPPRRRATSSPPAVQPLTLSPSGSQTKNAPIDARAHADVGHALKHDGPQWPATKASLFPRITEVVKAAPPHHGKEGGKVSWWQKILMFDPIVVEDLTGWLNSRGLSVGVVKRRKKSGVGKGKGRKRKAPANGEGDTEDGGPTATATAAAAEGEEFEVVHEPLQPWMVQKWCEEKSVCCYLRNGSWRGGRNR